MAKTIIPIGPYHPLQEEAEFFQLHVEGEKVVGIDVSIGYNHRGIEKISESLTFDQVPYLVERVCGICSTSHPLAYVQAVEEIGGIQVPERALYLRTIIAEMERLHSHLLWAGLAGHFLGYNTVWMWAWKYREPVLDVLEAVTGNRQNYAFMKVGGIRRDFEKEDIFRIDQILDELKPKIDLLTGAVMDDPVLHARVKGVGILKPEDAYSFGAVGPTARASGIKIDVRRDEPYAAYDRVEWDVITDPAGDVFARVKVRLLELYESVKIIRQCLRDLPGGEISARVKEIPPGEGIGRVEAPRGECFHYVCSDGTNRPVRHKIRAPSYVNVPTCQVTVPGETISDATIILASVDPCYSCTERMQVVDKEKGTTLSGKDLVRLSQEKTALLIKGGHR
ncbi:MAG: nickel-dependent hydrogenase large subunit [bacterium]|nr:nickel-dependent hydrogenase large subunit [bacterium]